MKEQAWPNFLKVSTINQYYEEGSEEQVVILEERCDQCKGYGCQYCNDTGLIPSLEGQRILNFIKKYTQK